MSITRPYLAITPPKIVSTTCRFARSNASSSNRPPSSAAISWAPLASFWMVGPDHVDNDAGKDCARPPPSCPHKLVTPHMMCDAEMRYARDIGH